MSCDTQSQYVKKRTKTTVEGNKRMLLICHRSSCLNGTGTGLRFRDPDKCVETDKLCPARLIVICTSDGVDVIFHKTHVGHTNTVNHLRLTETEREESAGMINSDIPVKTIIKKTRHRIPCSRTKALRLKDLYNIRDFSLSTGTRNKDFVLDTDKWIEERWLGDYSPVHYYKRKSENDLNGVAQEDFMLVVMTPYHKRMLNEFDGKKILIDRAHSTKPNNVLLTALSVIDEFGSGIPLAFGISSTMDEDCLQIFFKSVKETTGVIRAEVFMSDDFPEYYNAWCSVMGQPISHILCLWHVQNDWKSELSTITDATKQTEIYHGLQVLLVELDMVIFYQLLNEFLEFCKADSVTKEFREYFETNYACRPEMWSFAFRRGLRLNTNAYLQIMHNKLNYFWSNARANGRLDKYINALLKLSTNLMHDNFLELVNGKPIFRMHTVIQNHQKSIAIENCMIRTIRQNVWDVKSRSDLIRSNLDIHRVLLDPETICYNCFLSCLPCNVCVHQFSCTCEDYLIRGNFCKHAHACVRLKQSSNEEVNDHVDIKPDFQEDMEAMSANTLSIVTDVSDEGNLQLKLGTWVSLHVQADSKIETASIPETIKMEPLESFDFLEGKQVIELMEEE